MSALHDAVEEARQLLTPNAPLTELVGTAGAERFQAAMPLAEFIQGESANIPGRDELAAVRGMGWPWNVVADTATVLASIHRRDGVSQLARRLLRPDGFPDRLFQLAVVGAVIAAAESAGGKVTSTRPIGHMSEGPSYEIRDTRGGTWDLWCEAERCWQRYQAHDHHRQLAESLTRLSGDKFAARHLRPDILLTRPFDRALIIECKFPAESADPGYVASGMSQAYFYAMQLSTRFARTEAVVVGPSELVPVRSSTQVGGLNLSLMAVPPLAQKVERLMRGDDDA
ncbi:hypothetical protein [Mycobacterium sherrisii]|uniref:hypothetical protein n=1 Tax=Mycobacterium sherrisii TaxID=243061 RepID=UPI001151251F|nr:hypothetical protein [Mycobacterium sherrisii]MCV7032215.1 hypothetical protein [Mycobacterium sherrisii]